MIRAAIKGDFKKAKKINDNLIEGYELMFVENNPAGIKAAMCEMGLIENEVRLPLVPLSKPYHDMMKKICHGAEIGTHNAERLIRNA